MSAPVAGGPQAPQLRDPTGAVQWSRLYVSSAWSAWRGPGLPDVESFCFFIGYARSGHTLIGSLLNAHPEMVISHELDAVRFIEKGFTRSQLFSLILRRDEVFESMNRTWTGYDYNVPHQYQGRFDRLRVIGDKRGRTSALELGRRPELLERLRRAVEVPIRVIHITRNPYDNIATEAVRRHLPLAAATEWFEETCRAVDVVRPMLAPSELIDLSHESFTKDPKGSLTALCSFLGVDPGQSYLDACAAIVWPSTKRRRDAVEWSLGDRRRVEALIARYEFLDGYGFDE
jgi:hypothetical protein